MNVAQLSKIQYKVGSIEFEEIVLEIQELVKHEVNVFWLKPVVIHLKERLRNHFSIDLQFVHLPKTESDEADPNTILCYDAVDTEQFEQRDFLQIGQARTVVDCLNWDLKKIDFIEVNQNGFFGPKGAGNVLGIEGLKSLIPKEAEYGWMLLSLKTPVLLSGFSHLEALKDATKKIQFYGVCIDRSFVQRYQLADMLMKIKELL